MEEKKVALITGITGQDGSYLAEFLIEKGYEVHGLMRRSSSFNTGRIEHLYLDEWVRDMKKARLVNLHWADMTDSSSLVRVISKVRPTEIYNLAAQSHVKVSFDVPEYTADTDANGVLRLLEAVRICGLADTCRIYQASTSELYGKVQEVPQSETTPFYPRSPYAVAKLYGEQQFPLRDLPDITSVRTELTRKIEEEFGLNSMHIVRIEGEFEKVDARSEAPYRSHHITLKTVLGRTQKAFLFENIRGSLVGVYFPDYMDGINMPGWHLHFLSEDRSKGGHVFDVSVREGTAKTDKITSIYINLPKEAAFDTYSLKQDLQDEIKSVE